MDRTGRARVERRLTAILAADVAGYSRLKTDLLYDTGAAINSMPYRAGADQDRTSLIREIRRDGIDL